VSVYLPIISQFSDKGIKRAKREFQSLEGVAAKTKFVLRQAFAPATLALTGLATAAFSVTKAAMEDQKAQVELARQLRAVTNATDEQVASVEEWIAAQGRALGIADDELRPAYGALMRVTKDYGKTQQALSLAMDVSAATGKDLNTVTDLFAKALGGNTKALARAFPQYAKLIRSGASIDQVFAEMSKQVGGAAAEAANTSAGKFQRLKVRTDELKESIGAALLPIVEKAVPVLEKLTNWAENNQGAVLGIAAAIGAVSAAIVAANIAITLSNPFTAIAAGIALLITGLATAYKKFDWFRRAVDTVTKWILRYFEAIVNGWVDVINGIIAGYNLIPFVDNIGYLEHVDLTPDQRDTASAANFRAVEMASGNYAVGVVSNRSNPVNVTVNVNGGDPRAVVGAIQRWTRQNGTTRALG